VEDEEEKLLRETALKNAHSIFVARQRAEHERDQARAQADAARKEAQAALDAKGRFVNMVSHELRTPLGAIGGYAALLEEEIQGPLTEQQRKFVARIRHNQLHLLRLVNELLDLAKIESGQFPLTIASAPVRSIVESVSNMIEPQIRSKELSFEALYGEKDLCVLADRERVEQILLNLLSNAVKFTPAGGSITISTSHSKEEILLHVRDSGPGVPADKQEEIFQPFVQIHSLTPGMSRGTGLGLAISRELARAMAGDLSVKSEPDSGSTFTLCLPRIQ